MKEYLPEGVEWPDLDEAGAHEFWFLRAIAGKVTPPEGSSIRWCRKHKGAIEACEEAAEMMLQWKAEPIYKGQRPEGWRTPDEVVQDFLDTLDHPAGGYSAMSDVVFWLARHSPRFWGVEDLETQWYCSYCDSKSSAVTSGAISKDRFTRYAWKCDRHAGGK